MPQFQYVEMVCWLDQKHYDDKPPVEGVVFEPISKADTDALLDCYLRAFRAGDAQFFKLQNAEERRRYYHEELGFPEVLSCPASFTYTVKDEIVGFALVIPYLADNYHISCMCVLPAYRQRGMGKAMLNKIKNIALENGRTSLTLGTETEMKAYRLYKNNGFVVTATHTVDM